MYLFIYIYTGSLWDIWGFLSLGRFKRFEWGMDLEYTGVSGDFTGFNGI